VDRGQAEQARRQASGFAPKEFVSGEEFFYLGEPYRLQIETSSHARWSSTRISSVQGAAPGSGGLRKMYRRQALRVMSERVDLYATANGFEFNRIRITLPKQWAPADRGNLRFAWPGDGAAADDRLRRGARAGAPAPQEPLEEVLEQGQGHPADTGCGGLARRARVSAAAGVRRRVPWAAAVPYPPATHVVLWRGPALRGAQGLRRPGLVLEERKGSTTMGGWGPTLPAKSAGTGAALREGEGSLWSGSKNAVPIRQSLCLMAQDWQCPLEAGLLRMVMRAAYVHHL